MTWNRLKMNRNCKHKFCFLVCVTLIFICGLPLEWTEKLFFGIEKHETETIHLAAVSCSRPNYQGVRDIQKPMDLTLTMVKSAVLFAHQPMHVHVFTEEDMVNMFETEFQSWPDWIRTRVQFSVRTINYNKYMSPEMSEEWKKWYKPCGSYRLLLPMILEDIATAAIYSDSDVIFVKSIDGLWAQLKQFTLRQVAAISPTADHPLGGSKDNENFIFHKSGLFQINTGIMLMNFTRMLKYDWMLFDDVNSIDANENESRQKYGTDLLMSYYKRYRGNAEHDQKLLNIIFHHNPELIKQLSCSWNFKNNFCQDNQNICHDAEVHGAGAVHGITSKFFGNENPTFRALYEALLKYDFEKDVDDKLLHPFMKQLQTTAKDTFCGRKSHVVIEPLTKSVDQLMKNMKFN